jgi:hypothetical protein
MNREQTPGIGRGVLDVADARMLAEPRDHVEREVAALELRIGIEHDRNVDGVGDGAEIALHLRIPEREVGFEDGENAVGAELLVAPSLRDRVGRCGRGDARYDRDAAAGGGDRRAHHRLALGAVEIGELAGRAERGQPMHAGRDEIIDQPAQHVVEHAAGRVDRRDEIGIDAAEIAHAVRVAGAGVGDKRSAKINANSS